MHTVTDHNLVIVEQICRHPEALPFLASLVDPDRLPPLPPVPRLHIAGKHFLHRFACLSC